MARSLNRVQLIGNLTRDPELRYTPSGSAVCTFGLATNRSWTTDAGEKREEVDFHKIVSWNKLAELCSQFLTKGRKVYVEGRLSTRNWTAQDGAQKTTTEVIIDDMILLDNKGGSAPSAGPSDDNFDPEQGPETKPAAAKKPVANKDEVPPPSPASNAAGAKSDEEVAPDDIPF